MWLEYLPKNHFQQVKLTISTNLKTKISCTKKMQTLWDIHKDHTTFCCTSKKPNLSFSSPPKINIIQDVLVILTIELEVNLCYSWRFSWKMGQMVIFVEMMYWFKFYMDLSVFSCLETFRQTLGSNLGIGKSKLGFWSEKWVLPESYLS